MLTRLNDRSDFLKAFRDAYPPPVLPANEPQEIGGGETDSKGFEDDFPDDA